MLVDMNEPVADFEWDGLKVVDGKLLLAMLQSCGRLADVCKEVCPGIDMKW